MVEDTHFTDDGAGLGEAQGQFAARCTVEPQPDASGLDDNQKVGWVAALENHSYWMEKRSEGRLTIADAPPPAA